MLSQKLAHKSTGISELRVVIWDHDTPSYGEGDHDDTEGHLGHTDDVEMEDGEVQHQSLLACSCENSLLY